MRSRMLERNEKDDDETMLLTTAAIVLAFFIGLGAWLMTPEDNEVAVASVLPANTEQPITPTRTHAEAEPRKESRTATQPRQAQIAAAPAVVATVPEVAAAVPEVATAVPEVAAALPEIVTQEEVLPFREPEPVEAQPIVSEPVVVEPVPAPQPEPEPVAEPQAPGQDMVAAIDAATERVSFVTASTELTDDSKTILDEVAALMSANSTRRLGIIGHTDSRGEADANVKLSYARAQACADYLAAKGVKSNRMEVAGMGEQMPISSNLLAEGREQNRRVEFKLLEQ